MRPINYFKKRFEYAIKSAGKDKKPTICLNQNDIEALNQIIEFYDKQYKNTQLEDALLLFYILQNWKVENKENLQMKEISDGIFKLTDSKIIFQRIGMQMQPKAEVIKNITSELRLHQKINNVADENLIRMEDVARLLEAELEIAKSQFPFLKQLNGRTIVKFTYPKGLTEGQRKMLGLNQQ